MRRRDFFKKSFSLGTGMLLLPAYSTACNSGSGQNKEKSRLVIARDTKLFQGGMTPDSSRARKLLDNAMCAYFDVDQPIEAWKHLFNPGETVGLKVNCLSGLGSTHKVLVDAITECLREAGIRNIIIWDRFNSDLEDGGYQIQVRGNKLRCFGNDAVGFSDHFESFGEAASLVSKTLTELCDSVINIPVLKDHGIAGITMAMKNMFGAIHNPHKFHINVGDPYIADVFMYRSIKRKVKLHIGDAFTAQYEGGPSFMPHWRWNYCGLMVAEDPVAMDYSGWQIIEKKRTEMGKESLKDMGREPTYIATAADSKHRLGINNPDKIDIVYL